MKLTTFFTTGLCCVAARPMTTGPAANPQNGRKTLLSWEPTSAYVGHFHKKEQWEQRCDKALAKAGCAVGKIHMGVTTTTKPNREKTYYVNVEGAPTMDDMEHSKKLRVFADGTSEEGWSVSDRAFMRKAHFRRLQRDARPKTGTGHTALLFWDPENTYSTHPKRRVRWEQLCDDALTKEGCWLGMMHKGESKYTKPNGETTKYHNVEGASSLAGYMENRKLLRVFDDGSYQEGWLPQDLKTMADAKRWRRGGAGRDDEKGVPGQEPRRIQLSWDPEDAYIQRSKKRIFWENRCHEPLAKEDCDIGIIHKGVAHDGKPTSYVRVQGKSVGRMEHTKEMRVFQNGSYEMNWSNWDRANIREAKRQRQKPHIAPIEATPKHSITWDPPDTHLNSGSTYRALRKSYEDSCREALDREGCDLAIIYKGFRRQTHNDGTPLHYVMVAAGNKDRPDTKKYMRLFEDGSSEWLDPQPESHGHFEQVKGPSRRRARTGIQVQGESTNSQAPQSLKRPRGEPQKGPSSSTQLQVPGAPKRQRIERK